MISIFILPSNHFWNWDAQREELTDVQREKGREKERLTDAQREKDRVVNRDPAKHRIDCDHAKRRSQSCEASIAISRSTAPIAAPRRTQSSLSIPSSLNLTGFDDFFFWVLFVFLYWGMNDIIYLFGNRENVTRFDDFFSGYCLCFCIEEWMKVYLSYSVVSTTYQPMSTSWGKK